ncbi:MAG TPA: ABC transporter permease [Candidatus Limnocylindrales bacterium]|nr:ABC transporter permease [Candidatus Limnocylindrales bacterium]
MNARRLRAIVRRVTAEIRRDRPSLALLFVAPILITGLVTYILRAGETPVPTVALVNELAAPAGVVVGAALTTALEDDGIPVTDAEDEAAARASIEDGSASVAIVLPADLPAGGTITFITEGVDPASEAGQLAQVQRAVLSAAAEARGASIPSTERETVYASDRDDPIAPFAPAIVAFFVYFFVYVLTGVSFLRERTGGTLERLMATPVTRGEVVGGYLVGFGLFATVQVALLLLAWALGSVQVPAIGPLPSFSIGLGIEVAGSPALAFGVVLLLALGAVSLGIFLSTFARTELQVIQFIPIVLAPQFLLSGVLFPVDSLPALLQPLVLLMPLGYAVDALREVFIRGSDLSSAAVQLDLAVLAGIAVLFGVVASLTIRRDVV